MMDGRSQRASIRSVVLAFGLVLATGCQPVKCEETLPPILKLLAGIPAPMLFTVLFAWLPMLGIREALGRNTRWPRALAAVAATCALSGVMTLVFPMGLLVLWTASLIVVVSLSLQDEGPGPEQSWMHRLWGPPAPSLNARIVAWLLVLLLMFITFVGSVATTAFVVLVGQECHPVDLHRPPPGSPD